MLEPKFSGGRNPFDSITWVERDVEIKEGEKVIFKQENVRMPEFFAGMSAEVISQKYLTQIAGIKESNVQDMYERVVKKLVQWAIEGEYLSKEEAEIYGHELRFLLVNQMVMFNSPVWFNVGVREHPQTSACYILEIDDSMESILQNAVIEGSIFKWGSGCGSNRSRLRGSEEAVSGGGHASGPVVFMEIYDAIANVVRSGGITRRAAKMEILNIDHPDIEIFIDSKPQQELLAKSLIRSGWDQVAAYDSVKLQNLNQAVRVTDEFMKAVEIEGMWELKARVSGQVTKVVNAKSLFRRIAKAAWECGDPGIQFDSEINRWNTCAVDGNIEASNPCSEFMFLNNTSCNLASINLLKFRKPDGTFDVEAFLQAIKVLILSQDALIDNSYYPTPQITEASRAYRPLGINYSNLAALLMSLGLPYDSEEGRALAQAITSLMTAYSYVVSNEIARKKGVFPAYVRNSVKMRKVLKQHRSAAFASEPTYPEAKRILYASRAFWDQVIGFASDDGKDLGFRNAQVSVLAPTGTVSWAMGCDSFGVEPYFQLVTIKSLRDGGTLKTVPVVAPMALRFMGYDEIQAKDIFEFIVNRGHVDGAPHLKPEHIPVFDCAIGRRPLSWVAHLKMMEVVQPFISGAISKTVNLPTNVTIEDIMQVYIDAWKRKLKSIIVYRYGSKDYQPLKGIDENDLKWGQRKHIPDTCKAVRHKFEIGGLSGYLHPTPFESGQLAECFARMQKQGDLTNGLMDFALIMMSFALQYGAPLKAIVKKHMDTSYGPAGKVISDPVSGYKTVPYAKSVGEYIVHWLGLNFLTEKEQQEIGLIDHEAIRQERKTQAFKVEEVKSKSNVNTKTSISLTPQFGAQICIPCGVSMVPDGTCWICPLCKKKSGGCPS